MIVCILGKSGTFDGVGYNLNKILLNKAELMAVENFGALQGLSHRTRRDYISYLEVISQRNTRMIYPQLHAAISAKGREKNKYELTEIAHKWLKGMGYGEQPYLLVFHKDTAHNHLHLITSRVRKDGKTIYDDYEWQRAYVVLNQILGISASGEAAQHIRESLAYQFSVRADFMQLLRTKGYSLTLKDETLEVYKYGSLQARLPLVTIDQRSGVALQNSAQLEQLRMVIQKYHLRYNPEIYPVYKKMAGGGLVKGVEYTSELASALREKLGLQIVFNLNDGRPHEYTVIDHLEKAVYKGSWVMPLSAFIAPASEYEQAPLGREQWETPRQTFANFKAESEELRPPGVLQGFKLDIAGDADDEAIYGRRRRRTQREETNRR